MQNLQEKLRDHLIPIVIFTLAFLAWIGVGWLWWQQEKPIKSIAVQENSDQLLAQSYVLPTTLPTLKGGLPESASINSPLTAAFSLEAARVLRKNEDQIELVTQTADISFAVDRNDSAFFWVKETGKGIMAGEPADFTKLEEGQIVYLVRNDFGIVESVLVEP